MNAHLLGYDGTMTVSVGTGGDLIARTSRWLHCIGNPIGKKKSAYPQSEIIRKGPRL
jgi:hypothetical protein